MLLEYQLDWIKIVDFLLIAKFWACVLFFVHPLLDTLEYKPIHKSMNKTAILLLCIYFIYFLAKQIFRKQFQAISFESDLQHQSFQKIEPIEIHSCHYCSWL